MAKKDWLEARMQVSLYLVNDSSLKAKLEAWMDSNKHRQYAPAISEILDLFLSGHRIDDVPDDRLGDRVLELMQKVDKSEADYRVQQGRIEALERQVESLQQIAALAGLTKAAGELELLKKDAAGLTRGAVAKKLGYENLHDAARALGFRDEEAEGFTEALAEKVGYRVEGEGRLAKFYPPL